MKRNKNITAAFVLYAATLSQLLAACSADEQRPADAAEGTVPVTISAGISEPQTVSVVGPGSTPAAAPAAVTRAATTINSEKQFEEGEGFYVAFASGTTRQHAIYRVTTKNTTVDNYCTPDFQPYVTATGTAAIAVYGYYPLQVNEQTASWTVAQNQCSTADAAAGPSADRDKNAAYRASDLMFAKGTMAPATGIVETATGTKRLSFKHQMAKIVVNATPKTNGLKIQQVNIVSGYRTIAIDVTSGTNHTDASDALLFTDKRTIADHSGLSDAVSKAAPLKMYDYGTGTDGSTNAQQLSCAALMPPQQVQGDFLQVVTNRGTVTYKLGGAALDMQSGHCYTFTFDVAEAMLNQTVDMTLWAAGTTNPFYEQRRPSIGDLYYSDGTWGPYAAGKTPIGIVFHVGTTEYDQALGYRNGYVMALKDATTPAAGLAWASGTSATTQMTGSTLPVVTDVTTAQALMSDLDGLKYCTTAGCAKGADAKKGELPAMKAALDYTPAAPAASSGWYLPSIGQMYKWFEAFCVSSLYYDIFFPSSKVTSVNTGSLNHTQWAVNNEAFYIAQAQENESLWEAMDEYILARLGDYASAHFGTSFRSSDAGEAWWSSTEVDVSGNNQAWFLEHHARVTPYNANGTSLRLHFWADDLVKKTNPKCNGDQVPFRVRAVLAF